jgi:hypothetical protein
VVEPAHATTRTALLSMLHRLTQARVTLTQARVNLTQARVNLTQARVTLTQARVNLTQARVNLTQALVNLSAAGRRGGRRRVGGGDAARGAAGSAGKIVGGSFFSLEPNVINSLVVEVVMRRSASRRGCRSSSAHTPTRWRRSSGAATLRPYRGLVDANRMQGSGCGDELTPPFHHARPTPLSHDCSPYRGLHVPRGSVCAVPRFKGRSLSPPCQTLLVRIAPNEPLSAS